MQNQHTEVSRPQNRWQIETTLVHGGIARSEFGETCEALYLTQGYVYPSAEEAERRARTEVDGFIYSRFSNPTVAMFEERVRLLEGAEAARATATGMAAVTSALLCCLRAGDHVIAARALFGGCRYVVDELCPKLGIETTIVDGADIEAWQRAVQPNTRLFFFETPANPTLEIVDIAAVSAIAHTIGARVVVDNVFATPMLQRPLELGADVVVYSATKHIDGQGRCMGGIVLASQDYVDEFLHPFLKNTGPTLSPFNAWVLLKGLETMPLRVDRQSQTSGILAEFLAGQPRVDRMLYPTHNSHAQADIVRKQMKGGGQVVSFELSGGKQAAFQFLNRLQLIKLSNNLGDAKSLITHPATTTHFRLSEQERTTLGITDGLVRLSVGLEAPQDLLDDLSAALM